VIGHYKAKANFGIWVGFLIQLGARVSLVLFREDGAAPAPELLGGLVLANVLGFVLLLWGCTMYAKSKGRSGAFGMFGFLGLIGVFLLSRLEDRAVDGVDPHEARGFDVLPASNAPDVRPYF